MKRIILFSVIVAFFATTTQAQFFRYGIKGGVNSSKVKVDKTMLVGITTTEGTKDYLIEQGYSKLGFHAGVFGRIQALGIFIQPELLYTQTNGQLNIFDQSILQNPPKQIVDLKFSKFDIPVMVGKKFGPAKVFLGPVASFVISDKSNFDEILSVEKATNELKKAVFGYQAGIGLDIFKLATLDIKYEGNLSKLGNSINIGNREFNFDQRNPQIIFSLGIFL
ncbi:MAG: outer membrane beta-barrel protein [Bacteroidales bacterium]|nr:outer membrane beta-barrel protein [Bacteroidales bacterium]